MDSQSVAEHSAPLKAPDASAKSRRPVLLTIAGFDPSAGAGITADLKVFAAFGLYGMACVTALTVQSTQGVRRVEPVTAATVRETLEMLSEDVEFAGIKIGMLGTMAVAAEVARFVAGQRKVPVVLDPVLRSSSGRELLEPEGLRVLRERLLAAVSWATPNLDELAVLAETPVRGKDDVPSAAERLREIAARDGNDRLNLLVTGGDLEQPDDYLLLENGEEHWLRGRRVETSSTHGTGCALSSALVCGLARGHEPKAAAAQAKTYVENALRAAYPVGQGKGPMNHLFALERR